MNSIKLENIFTRREKTIANNGFVIEVSFKYT